MSVSYRNNRKARKLLRTEEQKTTAQKIRNGLMPKYFLAVDRDNHLERDPKDRKPRKRGTIARLTWRLSNTYRELTKKESV